MDNFFTISQTAQIVKMTAETLRHYDRIGLIRPSKTDKWTNYRYYSEHDIVCLNTIHALRCMDMSLSEIKEILEFDDFGKITRLLRESEKKADIKIAELNYAKTKIQTSRKYYESKLDSKEQAGIFINAIQQRVVLLSEQMSAPSLDILWNYHRHFYKQVGDNNTNNFSFEDLAGIYESHGQSHLFAVCTRHSEVDGLRILPKGRYLCSNCTEKNRENLLTQLLKIAKCEYDIIPEFTIQIVVLSGILKWNYQLQVLISEDI